MTDYKFTEYFEKEVLRKRSYLKKEWCIHVIKNQLKVEPKEHNRFRFWGMVPELEDRVLRVITLSDKKPFTTHFLTGGSNHEIKLLSRD